MFFKVTSVKNGEKIVHYYNNITQEIYTEKGIPVYLQQDPRCQPMVDGYNIRPSRLREKKTNKVRHLRIQLGLNCNFHCKYCNQARDRQSVVSVSLPPETATRRLIEKLQKANIQTSRITLWGGEPFVYYKLLKVLVPALRKQFPNCQISTVSNGSLFDMEKAQWCIDNELQLTISHDAFSFNVYRDDENCLDNPDVVLAIKYYMNMCDEKYVENPKSKIGFSINVVVTPENCNILDIDQYFEEKIGRSVRWHFEGIVKCDENNHNVVHKFDKQHRQTLLTHMMIAGTSDPSGPYWSIREKVSRVLGYIINQVDANSLLYPCDIANSEILAIDMQGNILACHGSDPDIMSIGTIDNLKEAENTKAISWKARSKCGSCPVLITCLSGCCIASDSDYEYMCDNLQLWGSGILAAAWKILFDSLIDKIEPATEDEIDNLDIL